jgi:hypothetical protein
MTKNKKKLLILVGPQGSGNHIFSRIFSIHPDVHGWKNLKDKYWLKHHDEPFNESFLYPNLLTEDQFDGFQHICTGISYPSNFDGIKYQPKILEFAAKADSWGIDVTIAIICRDEQIVREQQMRLRKNETIDEFKLYVTSVLLPSKFPVHFLSLETFFCYKQEYLQYLSKVLDFPIDYTNPDILKFITESPNKKYITPITEHWLDKENSVGILLTDLIHTGGKKHNG